MNWKPQTTAFFWVPVPYVGQSRIELIEWQFSPDKPRKEISLINPDTNQEYTAEIIHVSDVWPMDQLPDWHARDCTNIPEMTGHALAQLLKKHLPEFRNVKKVIFYQLQVKKNA